MNKHLLSALLAGGIAAVATTTTQAQANDALLNKLVSKGILTKQEADELKTESDAGFDKSYRARTGLPEWVTSLKLSGDVRGRAEGFWTANGSDAADNYNNDRWRMRYRLRFGVTATLKDQLELGFRLTSDDAVGSFGGDPISANTTYQDNASKKFVYIDQAYGKWTPLKGDRGSLSATIGKMANPFDLSTLLIDDDYTPEGVALQGVYNLNKSHTLKFNGGFFWLDEISQGSDSENDSFFLGAQAKWDAKWTDRIDTSIGATILAITDEQTLTNFSIPNVNVGNTRLANGALEHDYTPIILDAALTYTFDSAPLYKGKFPVRVAGTYVHNPGASEHNDAYEAGIAFGKSGKKGTWDFSYRWRRMEADSWFEEITDSDFGGFYQAGLANASSAPGSIGTLTGYRPGPGTQGHILKASYSPYDAITLGVTYYLAELIDAPNVGTKRDPQSLMSRVQLDMVWKF
jgi:hypothetical protein